MFKKNRVIKKRPTKISLYNLTQQSEFTNFKKNTMKNLIYLFIFTLGIFSCSSDEETNNQNPEPNDISLIGRWKWTITEGGISGIDQVTPESYGKDIQLNLNENLSYSILENGIEIFSGNYTLILASSIYSNMDNFISYSENIEYDWSVIFKGVIRNQDTSHLTISDNNNDGFTSHFEKID